MTETTRVYFDDRSEIESNVLANCDELWISDETKIIKMNVIETLRDDAQVVLYTKDDSGKASASKSKFMELLKETNEFKTLFQTIIEKVLGSCKEQDC